MDVLVAGATGRLGGPLADSSFAPATPMSAGTRCGGGQPNATGLT
jgi:hypothetical protein